MSRQHKQLLLYSNSGGTHYCGERLIQITMSRWCRAPSCTTTGHRRWTSGGRGRGGGGVITSRQSCQTTDHSWSHTAGCFWGHFQLLLWRQKQVFLEKNWENFPYVIVTTKSGILSPTRAAWQDRNRKFNLNKRKETFSFNASRRYSAIVHSAVIYSVCLCWGSPWKRENGPSRRGFHPFSNTLSSCDRGGFITDAKQSNQTNPSELAFVLLLALCWRSARCCQSSCRLRD